MKKLIPIYIILLCLLSSCGTYMLSPINTSSNPYLPLPLKQKGTPNKSETYISECNTAGSVLFGSGQYHFSSIRAVQSHAFGRFRAAYAGTVNMGFYRVDYTRYNSETLANAGSKFVGSGGVNGAICFAVPLRRKLKWGEWRTGAEGGLHGEFGQYLHYRKATGKQYADFIDKNKYTGTAAFFTDFTYKKGSGELGYKLAISFSTLAAPFNSCRFPTLPRYTSNTWHYSKQKLTGFLQINTGTEAASMQVGMLLKLGK